MDHDDTLTFPIVSDDFTISIPGQEFLWADHFARTMASAAFWSVILTDHELSDAIEHNTTGIYSRAASFALQNNR